MYYAYIIQSEQDNHLYVGYTENLKKRFDAHNMGQSTHTAKYKPWKLIFYSAFIDSETARGFEKYLKSHSGKAFAQKRLIHK